ncbi:MAG: hypothetical protein AAF950_17135 [Pseudomonadota bacterium]
MPKPMTMGSRKMVSLPSEMAEKVEDYRYEQRFKTEADAIRELIRLGLEAAKREKEQV